jgi:hypothetical protein
MDLLGAQIGVGAGSREASPLSLQLRLEEGGLKKRGGWNGGRREATPGRERQVITHKKIAGQQ